MVNKRKQKRFIRRCEVEFTADNLTLRGISSDLSLTGLFIRTNHPFPPGTVIDIVIHLPDGLIARVKGTAVRALKTPTGMVIGTPVKSVKNGMGIELTETDANYIHHLSNLHG